MLNSFKSQKNNTPYQANSGFSLFARKGAVTSSTAQRISWVFGAVNIKANALGTIPIKIYESTENGKSEYKNHNLYEILRYAPNDNLTSYEWQKMISQDLDLRGNHYSQVVRNGLDEIQGIYPLLADKMKVEFDSSKRKIYTYDNKKINSYQVLHILDIPDSQGLKGLSRIEYAKETFTFANNASKHGNKVFENGIAPTGTFESPKEYSDKAYSRLKSELEEKYEGVENAGRTMLLEEGLKFNPISIKNADAQWIESKKFNREEIATIFGVPSAMLNDTANTAYTNLEQKNIEFYTGTVLPITIACELRFRLSLLSKEEKKKISIKFKYNSLMRVDSKTRAEYFKDRYNTGSMSPNEIREHEDENGFEGGDNHFMQLAMTTVDRIIKGDNNE